MAALNGVRRDRAVSRSYRPMQASCRGEKVKQRGVDRGSVSFFSILKSCTQLPRAALVRAASVAQGRAPVNVPRVHLRGGGQQTRAASKRPPNVMQL